MIKKSYPKLNIFLKITGYKDGYHTIFSRFVKLKSIFDLIKFEKAKCETFTIEGFDEVPIKENTITKAFYALNQATGNLDILEFFYNHKVVVEKNIPTQAGLGGGSSNAGVFLNMVNEVCSLGLSKDQLAKIGAKIGADVPFFVYDFESANVSGFGEIVEEFKEDPLEFEILIPPFGCNTKDVYLKYKELNKGKILDIKEFESWKNTSSKEILQKIKDPYILNDLLKPATLICKDLKNYLKDGYFFSGSGSTFFSLKKKFPHNLS